FAASNLRTCRRPFPERSAASTCAVRNWIGPATSCAGSASTGKRTFPISGVPGVDSASVKFRGGNERATAHLSHRRRRTEGGRRQRSGSHGVGGAVPIRTGG